MTNTPTSNFGYDKPALGDRGWGVPTLNGNLDAIDVDLAAEHRSDVGNHGKHGPKVTIVQSNADNALVITKSNISTGNVVDITNSGTGNGISLSQVGNGQGLVIGQSGNNNAVQITKSSTDGSSAVVLNVTTGSGMGLAVYNSGTGAALQVDSTSGPAIYTTGKVGINFSAPTYQLEVKETAASSNSAIRILSAGNQNRMTISSDASDNTQLALQDSAGTTRVGLYTGDTSNPPIALNAVANNARGDVAFGVNRTSDPATTTEGDLWYNATANVFKYYDGSAIQILSTASVSLQVAYNGGQLIDESTLNTVLTIKQTNTLSTNHVLNIINSGGSGWYGIDVTVPRTIGNGIRVDMGSTTTSSTAVGIDINSKSTTFASSPLLEISKGYVSTPTGGAAVALIMQSSTVSSSPQPLLQLKEESAGASTLGILDINNTAAANSRSSIVINSIATGTGSGITINQSGTSTAAATPLRINSSSTSSPLITLAASSGNARGDVAFGVNRTSDSATTTEGDLWYNATANVFKYYDGTAIRIFQTGGMGTLNDAYNAEAIGSSKIIHCDSINTGTSSVELISTMAQNTILRVEQSGSNPGIYPHALPFVVINNNQAPACSITQGHTNGAPAINVHHYGTSSGVSIEVSNATSCAGLSVNQSALSVGDAVYLSHHGSGRGIYITMYNTDGTSSAIVINNSSSTGRDIEGNNWFVQKDGVVKIGVIATTARPATPIEGMIHFTAGVPYIYDGSAWLKIVTTAS